MSNSNPVVDTVRAILDKKPVYLDTETTGLDSSAEIVEITILDHDGSVLLDQLIKPTRPIPSQATAIHGIRNADVDLAPSFADILPQLADILDDRTVVIYNAEYDLRLMNQSALYCNLGRVYTHCAMLLYAEYHGEWNYYRDGYTWQSLTNAAIQCGIVSPLPTHRARADADLTRRVCRYMAHKEKFSEFYFGGMDHGGIEVYEVANIEEVSDAIAYGQHLAEEKQLNVVVYQRHAIARPAGT